MSAVKSLKLKTLKIFSNFAVNAFKILSSFNSYVRKNSLLHIKFIH